MEPSSHIAYATGMLGSAAERLPLAVMLCAVITIKMLDTI